MNYSEYIDEINSIAAELVSKSMGQSGNDREAAEEPINDTLLNEMLHETIDGHQWVRYYSYNDDVIKHSDNDEYYRNIYNNESIGSIVAEKSTNDLKAIIAYWAMHADVQERIGSTFDELEEAA